MNNLAQNLTDYLAAAGIPLEGVSIGRRDDRSTWRVDFTADATDEHRTQAAALLRSFTPKLADPDGNPFAARQAAITDRRAVIASDLVLLPTATAAQQRQILARFLQAEDDRLNAETRELDVLRRLIKAQEEP